LLFPPSLVKEIWKRRCVLFVGAGLSAAAKLPDWKSLLRAMVTRLEDEDLARESRRTPPLRAT
jgi:NAD-dependent SIR2 family protein deacetylase